MSQPSDQIESQELILQLKDEFYKDSFGKIVFIFGSLLTAIVLLVILSIYIYMNKPVPVNFPVEEEWRVQPAVPVNLPYLSTSDLLQWVSNSLPDAFVYDFNHYNDQLKEAKHFFTDNGWRIFLNQLNIYANYNNVQANRLFVNGNIVGAPFILTEGLITNRYAWWVQVPIQLNYAGFAPTASKTLTFQVLVMRVPTLDNLSGVAIDNIIVQTGEKSRPV